MKKTLIALIGLASCTNPNYDRIATLESQHLNRMRPDPETRGASKYVTIPIQREGEQYVSIGSTNEEQNPFRLLIYDSKERVYREFVDHAPVGLRVEDGDEVRVPGPNGISYATHNLTDATEPLYNKEFEGWLEYMRAERVFGKARPKNTGVAYKSN